MFNKILESETAKWSLSFVCAAAFIAVVLYGSAKFAKQVEFGIETVESALPVGYAKSAQFQSGMLDDKTTVETSKGIFLVYGTFQVTKEQQLEIQTRVNKDRYLCAIGTKVCKKLIE